MTLTQESYQNLTIDSILIAQKDSVLQLINNSVSLLESYPKSTEEPRNHKEFDNAIVSLRAALFTLTTLRDLWIANSYGYKFNELLNRIDDSVCRVRAKLTPSASKKKRQLREIYNICKHSYVPQELHLVSSSID